MSRIHVYADEAGNFDFSRNAGASKYFILTTVTLEDHALVQELLDLRRNLAWSGVNLPNGFHATSDKQAVRNQVFSVLTRHDFRIDATILEKSKAQPQTRTSDLRFYKYAWFYHMKHNAPTLVVRGDELMVTAASITTKKKQAAFVDAIEDVMSQSVRSVFVAACWSAESDPALQVADYCCWAIQRKWEGNDARSHRLIQDKIATEYDLWLRGSTHFY